MRKRQIPEKLARFFKFVYLKLVKINDSPQRIAIGFGLGVFTGIMPGAGPVVALFLAVLFRVNRASAFLGGFLTNTWVTFLAFLFSIKIGSFIFGIDGEIIRERWTALLKDFHISKVFKLSVLEMALPVLVGYLALAAISAILAYGIILVILKFMKKRKERLNKDGATRSRP